MDGAGCQVNEQVLKSAARLFDLTAHGGSIVFGAATVLIGEFAAVGAATVFPGQQHFGNCGVQSSQQLIHQATDQNPDENAILGLALAGAPKTANAGEPVPLLAKGY